MSDVKNAKHTKTKPLPEPEINTELEICQAQVKTLEEQIKTSEEKYRRALADYQNLERQTALDQQRFAKIATQVFVEQMLTPFDHLKLAAKHLNDKGLELVVTQFEKLFASQGLQEVKTLGKVFDARSMEAVGTRQGKENEVLEVLQSGYELYGVLIRPAKVIVGKDN